MAKKKDYTQKELVDLAIKLRMNKASVEYGFTINADKQEKQILDAAEFMGLL